MTREDYILMQSWQRTRFFVPFCATQLAWRLSAQSEYLGGVVYKYISGMPAMGKLHPCSSPRPPGCGPDDDDVKLTTEATHISHTSNLLASAITSAGCEGLVC